MIPARHLPSCSGLFGPPPLSTQPIPPLLCAISSALWLPLAFSGFGPRIYRLLSLVSCQGTPDHACTLNPNLRFRACSVTSRPFQDEPFLSCFSPAAR